MTNKNLSKLILSHTRLKHVSLNSFHGIVNSLTDLDISNTNVTFIDFLPKLNSLAKISATVPEICCVAGDAVCKSDVQSNDVFGTCSNIFANAALLALAIMYCISILFLNSLSFIWHTTHSSFIKILLSSTLMFSDALMGVYILIMLIVDRVYTGNIFYISYFWKSSVLCRSLGTLGIISLQLSNISTMIISLDRFVCIVLHPFQRYGFTTSQTVLCVILGWLLGLVQPVLAASLSKVNISNSACVLIGNSLAMPFTIVLIIVSTLVTIADRKSTRLNSSH